MRILVLTNRPPWPLHYGDRLHCYGLVTRLAARHQLRLVSEYPVEADQFPFDFEYEIANDRRLYDGQVTSPSLSNRWERFFGISMDYCSDVIRLVHEWNPDIVIGMGYHSLSYLGRLNGYPTICDLSDDPARHMLHEALFGRENHKWNDFKGFIAALMHTRTHINKVDAVTLLSDRDRKFCQLYSGHSNAQYIPHGVDCDHYRTSSEPHQRRLVFWGGLGFGPNATAVSYFGNEVWPALRQQHADLRWSVIGRGTNAKLDLLLRQDGIDFEGFQEDIRPIVWSSAIAVVPMRSGGGIKNKIMEAWAMGKAVVCTPEALGDLPGEHQTNVWIGKDKDELIRGINRLLNDSDFRFQLGANARQTAVQQCSWDQAAKRLEALCESVIREHRLNSTASSRAVELTETGSKS